MAPHNSQVADNIEVGSRVASLNFLTDGLPFIEIMSGVTVVTAAA